MPNSNKGFTPKAFHHHFREAIRVGFNWERFFEEGWPIEPVVINTPAQLAKCFVPWYIDTVAKEVSYDHPEAAPMSLADVPKVMPILNEERRRDIEKKADGFRKEGGLIKFDVPTYGMPNDQYFVLDRNHRLSALTLVSISFEVTLWNVVGPLDPDCLLDLTYWHGKK